MSLINEALKKVQNQQGATGPTLPPGPPVTPHPPHASQPGKGKHRSFVWGFVVAILIIGLVTSLLATFFVWQILGTDEPVKKSDPVVVQDSSPDQPASNPAKPLKVENLGPEPEPQSAQASQSPTVPVVAAAEPPSTDPNPAVQTLPSLVESPEPVSTPPAQAVEPSQALPSAPVQTPSTAAVAEAPPPEASAPKPPDPAVVTRLQQVQIRGIMSGGIKVLIHDESTGRTRAYRVGENLEGTMGLVVVGITPNTIQFKDYAGSIHSKSF
jgi:hypothetical protein